MAESKALKVFIYSTTTELEKKIVDSVKSENSEGEFSILPEHAQFLSVVENKTIEFYKNNEVIDTLDCNRAIIHVKDNKVNIFTDI